jgi:ABC-2 type transport system permease protein
MRRSIVWWSLGLIAIAALIVAVYPTVRDNPDLNKLVENYPDALKAFIAFGGELDYTSGAGYLGSELFAFIVPLLLAVAAIGAGGRATAGEEEAGTIELLLANPVSRRRLIVEKTAALATEVALLALVLWISLFVGVEIVGMDVSVANLAAATFAAALLAFSFGAIAVLAGSISGRRSVAIGVPAAVGVAATSSAHSVRSSARSSSRGRPPPTTTTSPPIPCGTGWIWSTWAFSSASGSSRSPWPFLPSSGAISPPRPASSDARNSEGHSARPARAR